ncbi:MAG: hypothetical protein IPJ31_12940 [Bacteroidetes bacterium]|nr:hypothetical protein [Bacteroidota bacterium]
MNKISLIVCNALVITVLHFSVQGQGVWTWMKGSNVGASVGNYGVKGVSAPTNEPRPVIKQPFGPI